MMATMSPEDIRREVMNDLREDQRRRDLEERRKKAGNPSPEQVRLDAELAKIGKLRELRKLRRRKKSMRERSKKRLTEKCAKLLPENVSD